MPLWMTNLLLNILSVKEKKLKTPIAGTPIGETAFAVKKGSNPELLEKFNKGLANLKQMENSKRSW